jgi:predicted helicase
MTGIAISILVKKKEKNGECSIHYCDIGDDLKRTEKLSLLKKHGSTLKMIGENTLTPVFPDEHGDWIKQRDTSTAAYLPIGDKSGLHDSKLFNFFSSGINSARDAWCYNFSKSEMVGNISKTINFYNEEVARYKTLVGTSAGGVVVPVEDVVTSDPAMISWGTNLKAGVKAGRMIEIDSKAARVSLYRPFTKQWAYFHKSLNHSLYRLPQAFNEAIQNQIAICVSGVGARAGFSVIMTDSIPNFDTLEKGPCFPLFYSAQAGGNGAGDLFKTDSLMPFDGIADSGLKHFQDAYPGETITKEDLFYYVYGLLHSEDYRTRYADNLSKELPRIPCVKTAADFWAFSRAGRELGDLHVNYETVEPYPVTIKQGDLRLADIKNPEAFYRVTKWAFGKAGKEKDKTTVIYNTNITMQDIPLEAYDYVVNGKPALEWVMERQVVKVDKDSGIENDANRDAIETMNNPAYPLELFQRVITVSLRTMEIVRGLPKLEVM